MITFRTYRDHVLHFKIHYYGYIDGYKKTRLNNVLHLGVHSSDYLAAISINCLLTELQTAFDKKLNNTTALKIKFELSDALASSLYSMLLHFPLQKENHYLQMIRSDWIQILDKELIAAQIITFHKYVKDPVAHSWSDYEH